MAKRKVRKENAASAFQNVFSGIYLPQIFFFMIFLKENRKRKEREQAKEKFVFCIRFKCASKNFGKI